MQKSAAELDYPPKEAILISGEMVVFKLLQKADEVALNTFFSQVSDREAANLRDDVRDPLTISQWIRSLDYQRVLPLVAWNESSQYIVGVSTLHRMKGVYRHVADVRIFVGKGYRRLGLGSAMIKEIIEIGNRLGLYFLRAEILMENQLAIKAFRQLGFEVKCTLEEYFMDVKGETRDVMMLMKRLRVNMEEDFFYVF